MEIHISVRNLKEYVTNTQWREFLGGTVVEVITSSDINSKFLFIIDGVCNVEELNKSSSGHQNVSCCWNSYGKLCIFSEELFHFLKFCVTSRPCTANVVFTLIIAGHYESPWITKQEKSASSSSGSWQEWEVNLEPVASEGPPQIFYVWSSGSLRFFHILANEFIANYCKEAGKDPFRSYEYLKELDEFAQTSFKNGLSKPENLCCFDLSPFRVEFVSKFISKAFHKSTRPNVPLRGRIQQFGSLVVPFVLRSFNDSRCLGSVSLLFTIGNPGHHIVYCPSIQAQSSGLTSNIIDPFDFASLTRMTNNSNGTPPLVISTQVSSAMAVLKGRNSEFVKQPAAPPPPPVEGNVVSCREDLDSLFLRCLSNVCCNGGHSSALRTIMIPVDIEDLLIPLLETRLFVSNLPAFRPKICILYSNASVYPSFIRMMIDINAAPLRNHFHLQKFNLIPELLFPAERKKQIRRHISDSRRRHHSPKGLSSSDMSNCYVSYPVVHTFSTVSEFVSFRDSCCPGTQILVFSGPSSLEYGIGRELFLEHIATDANATLIHLTNSSRAGSPSVVDGPCVNYCKYSQVDAHENEIEAFEDLFRRVISTNSQLNQEHAATTDDDPKTTPTSSLLDLAHSDTSTTQNPTVSLNYPHIVKSNFFKSLQWHDATSLGPEAQATKPKNKQSRRPITVGFTDSTHAQSPHAQIIQTNFTSSNTQGVPVVTKFVSQQCSVKVLCKILPVRKNWAIQSDAVVVPSSAEYNYMLVKKSFDDMKAFKSLLHMLDARTAVDVGLCEANTAKGNNVRLRNLLLKWISSNSIDVVDQLISFKLTLENLESKLINESIIAWVYSVANTSQDLEKSKYLPTVTRTDIPPIAQTRAKMKEQHIQRYLPHVLVCPLKIVFPLLSGTFTCVRTSASTCFVGHVKLKCWCSNSPFEDSVVVKTDENELLSDGRLQMMGASLLAELSWASSVAGCRLLAEHSVTMLDVIKSGSELGIVDLQQAIKWNNSGRKSSFHNSLYSIDRIEAENGGLTWEINGVVSPEYLVARKSLLSQYRICI